MNHIFMKLLVFIMIMTIINDSYSQLTYQWMITSPDTISRVHRVEISPAGRIFVSQGANSNFGRLYALTEDGEFSQEYDARGFDLEFLDSGLMLVDAFDTHCALMNQWTEHIYWTYHRNHVKPHITTGYFAANSINGINSDIEVSYLNEMGQEVWTYTAEYPNVQTVQSFTSVLPNNFVIFIYNHWPFETYTFRIDKFNSHGGIDQTRVFEDHLHNRGGTHLYDVYYEPDGNIALTGSLQFYPEGQMMFARLRPGMDSLEFYLPLGEEPPFGLRFEPASDGGYFNAYRNYGADAAIHVVRYDAGLNLLWHDTFNHPDEELAGSDVHLAVTRNDEPVIAATYEYQTGPYDWEERAFIVKFNAVPTGLELELVPQSANLTIQPGETFIYGARLSNNTNTDIVTDAWVLVRGPNGYPTEPIRMWEDVTVPANGAEPIEVALRQWIPDDTPVGEFNYIVRVGDYPNATIQKYFSFTVESNDLSSTPELSLNPPHTNGFVPAYLPTPEFTARTDWLVW